MPQPSITAVTRASSEFTTYGRTRDSSLRSNPGRVMSLAGVYVGCCPRQCGVPFLEYMGLLTLPSLARVLVCSLPKICRCEGILTQQIFSNESSRKASISSQRGTLETRPDNPVHTLIFQPLVARVTR